LIPIEWSLVIKRNQSHQRELEPCTILLYRCFFFLRSRDFPHILHVYYVCYYTCIVRVLTITRQDPFSSHNILGTIWPWRRFYEHNTLPRVYATWFDLFIFIYFFFIPPRPSTPPGRPTTLYFPRNSGDFHSLQRNGNNL